MPEMIEQTARQTPPPPPAHEDAANARRQWSGYEWSRGGDEWSEGFGGTDSLWAGVLYPRLAALLPAGHMVEIGCGYGRISRYLRGFTRRLTLVDVTPRCVEACRQRFARDEGVAVVLNDGRSLAEVKGEADVVVSWGAMISVERSTVAEYLKELRRTLKPGGVAFIHHSNAGSTTANLGDAGDELLGGRRKSQSSEGFRQDCTAAGLRCLSQELMPFNGGGRYIDCFSLITRDEANPGAEATVVKNDEWQAELARCARLAQMYKKPA